MRITQPRGFVPRSRGCNLPPNFAEKAENLDQSTGMFQAWRQPVEILSFPEKTCAAHVRDCCWTGDSDPNTTYVDAGVDRKTYRSNPKTRPEVTDCVCEQEWTCLGYPVPASPSVRPIQNVPRDKGPDAEARTYRITYSSDCEEGPASCPSERVVVQKGHPVELILPPYSDTQDPQCNWGVQWVNVYRSQSVWDAEQGLFSLDNNPVQSGWTTPAGTQRWFLVARLPVNQTQFVDSELSPQGNSLLTEDYLPPPEGSQVVGETSTHSLVAWVDKTVILSEKNRYWAFPLRGYHDFPYCILDVKVCQDRVFVITQGGVYIIVDQADCRESSERNILVVKSPPAPSECLSCVQFRDGVLYTSQEGLAFVGPQGEHRVVSRPAFDTDSWISLGPIRDISTDDSVLMVSTDQATLVWVLSLDENGLLPPDVTSLSFDVDQWITDEKNNLYFLVNSDIFQFNAGAEFMDLDWKQAEQRFGTKQRLSTLAAEYTIKHSPCQNQVSVYRDGTLSILKSLGDKPRRVRNTATDCLQVRVKGPVPMCALSYGQGLSNLRGE